MGPEILAPIALAVGIEYAYQKGHLAIAVKWVKQQLTPAAVWVKENLIPESLFQQKDTAKSKDEWFFDEDDF
jgi:hypothetical protein